MIEAVDKMLVAYINQCIDLFKDSISVSEVARISLFNSPNVNESDIHNMFKDNIVGGPSIVFSRYHEKRKSFIGQK